MDKFLPTLTSLLIQLPLFLVWLVAWILALVFWRRHPKVSLLTVRALTGFLILSVVSTYLNLWLPLDLRDRGMSVSQIGVFLSVKGIVITLIETGLWTLIVIALFGWRKKKENPA